MPGPDAKPSAPPSSVRRIRFVEQADRGGAVRRRFRHPRPCVAVEEAATLPDVSRQVAPEATDQLLVVFLPPEAADESTPTPPAAEFAADGTRVRWWPGRAVVSGPAERRDAILNALTEFAFYEGELRRLERQLEALEPVAEEDVPRAYRIRWRDRRHWKRFATTIEECSRMRLTFGRLAPRLAKAPPGLPRESRRIVTRLLRAADVPARLEAFGDRLEACEDLYEGATDRVADYRGYAIGYWLEVIIIVLLALEVVIMSAELYIRYIDYFSTP